MITSKRKGSPAGGVMAKVPFGSENGLRGGWAQPDAKGPLCPGTSDSDSTLPYLAHSRHGKNITAGLRDIPRDALQGDLVLFQRFHNAVSGCPVTALCNVPRECLTAVLFPEPVPPTQPPSQIGMTKTASSPFQVEICLSIQSMGIVYSYCNRKQKIPSPSEGTLRFLSPGYPILGSAIPFHGSRVERVKKTGLFCLLTSQKKVIISPD